MNATHPCDLPAEQLERQCRLRFDRRSGPGGQHRNKVETAVVVLHEPTGISAEAAERRSQQANRRVALFRLRVNLALAVRTDRQPDVPSELWNARSQGRRLLISPIHEDFPALLAEVLDVLESCEYDLPRAAHWLSTTSSQLVRLLKREPRAWLAVNQCRVDRGLHALK